MSFFANDSKQFFEEVKNALFRTEEEVNTIEVEEVKQLLQKYDVVLKNNNDELDLIMKYENIYDKVSDCLVKKRKDIDDIEKGIELISNSAHSHNFLTTLNKKKENVNQIIDCNNRIVERIRNLETSYYDNKLIELDNMRVEKYDETKYQIEQNKQPTTTHILKEQQQRITQVPKEIKLQEPKRRSYKTVPIIKDSIKQLKIWSNKTESSVIFDSKFDGDGSNNNALHNIVFNRSNLYFITFDNDNNVFGGYVDKRIAGSGMPSYVIDEKAFVFSLMKNNKVNAKRAFLLRNNHSNGRLYEFGTSIVIYKVGCNKSCCYGRDDFYDYGDDVFPLTGASLGIKFEATRIVVLEMC
ncbi:TLDc domain-containing protein [Entamoeba marina]